MSDLDSDDTGDDEDVEEELEGSLDEEIELDEGDVDDIPDDSASLTAMRPGENARRRVEESCEVVA